MDDDDDDDDPGDADDLCETVVETGLTNDSKKAIVNLNSSIQNIKLHSVQGHIVNEQNNKIPKALPRTAITLDVDATVAPCTEVLSANIGNHSEVSEIEDYSERIGISTSSKLSKLDNEQPLHLLHCLK